MALSILDGNQSATTLSTIVTSGQHITAHTVVSLGTQAITDMRSAVSGSVVSISNFPASQTISGTVTANPTGTQTIAGTVTANASLADFPKDGGVPYVPIAFIDSPGGSFIQVSKEPDCGLPISGAVTASNISSLPDAGGNLVIRSFVFGYDYAEDVPVAVAIDNNDQSLLISGTVDAIIGSSIPAGTNRIGVVTIGGGTVTIGAGTAQIGSVTASISSNPSGALTTRFGSVTTANTAQITTAVTNTSRKYLFAQNISTGIVTIGVGFSPTTTQGIQLSPGSGIVFDSFCPTGAVYWLGATTSAAYTILEG